jgi:hypothetical protein
MVSPHVFGQVYVSFVLLRDRGTDLAVEHGTQWYFNFVAGQVVFPSSTSTQLGSRGSSDSSIVSVVHCSSHELKEATYLIKLIR